MAAEPDIRWHDIFTNPDVYHMKNEEKMKKRKKMVSALPRKAAVFTGNLRFPLDKTYHGCPLYFLLKRLKKIFLSS